ncbi:maleylacetoacetate isomerase [Acinetobacter gerneri]|uniref:Maleylacetoacetate isomerase n=1 Tax=Acinetobacter gerneri TaxID=202952 RepID=A0AAW8JLV2_9GAMM|nr:maleylacetoacetate isomerase [Acinetobacter gerneri]MDQ9009129.1 maleylacetoacetate isomerase [Acinetobacter gerneri]MDQ9013233.1 maleylacetoacetate isomerase [Acinetobacter gerneri]MDQ9023550.1 maleylacetoacetate isomerase [Acinetobacter gerneri]MDQ9051905.1 maleylacetoacetate isomerase [Acinetobacter gerneri]MDQ9059442.1 maleylacetoacetate isomerase [Acinetobacter gerneri]
MKLYSYFRSSAAYRVRIALNLKNLDCEIIPVHLLNNGGEQHGQAYRQINPSELLPALVEDDFALAQSLSILEYLEEKYPEHALLPNNLQDRARVRAFCQNIACDIHPLNNLRVLKYLKHELQISEDEKTAWYKHWVEIGFKSLEQQLVDSNGKFCFGDQATLADCCLIPQVYNAKRFNIDLSAFPKISAIYQYCSGLDAFKNAAPEAQIDAT